MSASKIFRELFAAASDIILGLLGWITIAPIAALIPKRRDWIAVIGRGNGQFLDNSKYFFIDSAFAEKSHLRIAFVTQREDVRQWISEEGLEALHFPSFASWWFLARCGVAVVDSIEWCERGRCFVLCRARIVQLWHGVGFKRIELDKWRNEAKGRRLMSNSILFWLRMLRKWARGRIPRYAAVVTTSAFYRDNVFKRAFRSQNILTTGYPRNAFCPRSEAISRLVNRNVDPVILENIERWGAQNRKIVLVAPTFRDTRASPLGLDRDTQSQIDQFCDARGCEFLFKFHPYEHGANEIRGRHLHVLSSDSDLYPLMPAMSVLVTDYSSIYMDFLLIDRPVAFLAPDLDQYVQRDRDIQFDFKKMTPGIKLGNWHELLSYVDATNDRYWKQCRSNMRSLAFDDNDQTVSTRRLLDFMLAKGWIRRIAKDRGIAAQ